LRAEVRAMGLPAHEATWLVDDFAPGGDPAARPDVLAAAARRVAGEPLQYILGHWPFRTLDVEVDSRVLIPRPETEELVDQALVALAHTRATHPRILDLGCGSGVIGLALLVELAQRGVTAQLIAVDQSRDALTVARRNAVKHGCVTASFVQSSWFDELDDSLVGAFDLIVSNPPYVAANEYDQLDPTLFYEPRSALVAPDAQGVGGFGDVAHIIRTSVDWLAPRGALVLEHGADQGVAATLCAVAAGFDEVNDVQDLSGRPRMLVAKRGPVCKD
jgi:release factor glutamine methyltransferase